MSSLLPPEVRMGNDIARQVASLDPDVAVATIAEHIERFWDPRMRATLISLANRGDDDLDPLLAAAAAKLDE